MGIKISALSAASTLSGAEEVPVVQSGATVRTTAQDIANLASSSVVDNFAVTIVLDGGGADITTGVKRDIYIPFAGTITAVTMLANASGSIEIDLWKAAYSGFPPVIGNSIVASAPPTLSSAVKSQDSTLTGWTKTIAAGDVIRPNVNSCSGIQALTLVLTVSRTL